MTQDQIGSAGASRTPRRFRYLIDIVILVAVVFGIEGAAVAVYTPKNMQSGLVFDAAIQMFQVLIACVLIWLRGERLADIGLKQPTNWWKTFLFGIAIAAVVFAGMYISEKAGFRRDLSRFKDVQGNLELAIYGVFYALIGAGFYEEFMFRGFIMHGLAMFFGANRGAWGAALIIQGVLFGASHAYQNPLGMLITGTLGVLLGILVIVSGRNLWTAIITHALFDASRSVLFYFQGPPTG